jgi:aryl-alcohol dehydrogenase-like predicted oxidoreductase
MGARTDRSRLALAPPHVKFVSSQPQYSLLYRRPEAKVIPISIANGIGQIVWSPLAQGVLSGKYLPGAAFPGAAARRPTTNIICVSS